MNNRKSQQYPGSYVDTMKETLTNRTDFVYPDEDTEEEQYGKDERLVELLRLIYGLLIASGNPKADLLAMLYIFDRSQTMQQRADSLAISKQVFHRHVMKMRKKLNLP